MAQAASILLGRYGLGEQIGGGGFSEVWEGTDLVLDRPVAIKMLHVAYAEHAETLARFRAEARNAASLSHENIAQVYDYGEAEPPNPPFLVMEFVAGPSLAHVLAGGAMDPARTMKIVAQAAAGLQAAHRAGLVHRDIKPGNLLLAPDDVVKITDFGIAYAAGSAPVTSTGLVIGTAGYLAPERVAGKRGSAASDLYALGVIAYECLVGAAPFTGVALEVALCHRERPLPALPASVPADVAALVSELTAKDPAARPGSAGAVARRAAELADRSIGDVSAAPCLRPVGQAGRPALAALPTRVEPMGVRRARSRPVPGRRGRPGRRWHGPGVRLIRRAAVAAIALVAAMTGLVMASVIGPSAPGRPLPVPSLRTSGPASSAARPEGSVARTHVNAQRSAPGHGRDRAGDQRHGNGPSYGGGQGSRNGNGNGHGHGNGRGNSDGNGHGNGHGHGHGNGPGRGAKQGNGNGPGQGGGPGSGNGPASGGPSVTGIQGGDSQL
jgi:eukaryotic-like serine/threonine-protein kinase